METVVLGIFCGALALCVLLHLSIVYAMVAGLAVFCLYARLRGFRGAALGRMVLSGVRTAKGMLLVFFLIGMLTALWRASGTIPTIVLYAVELIRPRTLVLMSFLLCCGMSVLTGTAFGTAATMGVICMALGHSMGADPAWLGGAILSGIYFGDRCSPVSTSALLISELTGTSIFDNIRRMLRTAWPPFLICCLLYGLAGLWMPVGGGDIAALRQAFGGEMLLDWYLVLPAVVLLVLSVCRVPVRRTMLVSIGLAALLALFVQHIEPLRLMGMLLTGYTAADPAVGALLDGGGILSMLQVILIVCISSAYAGIFRETGLLDRLKAGVARISRPITPFGGMLAAAVLSACIACNQTLTIMLTHQLCGDVEHNRQRFALELENSAVLVAPLIPWSIASATPLAAIGAPQTSLLTAFFCIGLPLCYLAARLLHRHRLTHRRPARTAA